MNNVMKDLIMEKMVFVVRPIAPSCLPALCAETLQVNAMLKKPAMERLPRAPKIRNYHLIRSANKLLI